MRQCCCEDSWAAIPTPMRSCAPRDFDWIDCTVCRVLAQITALSQLNNESFHCSPGNIRLLVCALRTCPLLLRNQHGGYHFTYVPTSGQATSTATAVTRAPFSFEHLNATAVEYIQIRTGNSGCLWELELSWLPSSSTPCA